MLYRNLHLYIAGVVFEITVPLSTGTLYLALLDKGSSFPCVQGTTRLVGVLLAWVDAARLQQLLTDRTGLQNTGEVIVGVPGVPEADLVTLLIPPAFAPSVRNIPLTGAIKLACVDMLNGTTIENDYRGQKDIMAYMPVGYQNWGMLVNR